MAQPPGMCTMWSTSVLNSNRTSGSQRVRAKRCQGSRVLAISPLFPRIRGATDAAFAMMEKMSADVVCKSPNFPLNVQVLGLVRRRFVVTWKNGHLLVLLIIYKYRLALLSQSLFWHSGRDPRATSSPGPLLHTKQMQQRKQAEALLVQAGIGAAHRATNTRATAWGVSVLWWSFPQKCLLFLRSTQGFHWWKV